MRLLIRNWHLNQIWKSVLIILIATFLSEYLFTLIPISRLPFSHFWSAIFERSLSSALTILAIWYLYPQSLNRFRLKLTNSRVFIAIGLILFVALPSLLQIQISHFSVLQISGGFVFALFIGIDEEIFSRGLIFGALEKYGTWVAAIVSSIHFGILHLGNAAWGGQSWSYTLAQVLGASAAGFLFVGLMLFTGSIWIPIFFHGLIDTPMQFETITNYTSQVTGAPNWGATLAQSVFFSAIGGLLIKLSNRDSYLIFIIRVKKYFLEPKSATPVMDQ